MFCTHGTRGSNLCTRRPPPGLYRSTAATSSRGPAATGRVSCSLRLGNKRSDRPRPPSPLVADRQHSISEDRFHRGVSAALSCSAVPAHHYCHCAATSLPEKNRAAVQAAPRRSGRRKCACLRAVPAQPREPVSCCSCAPLPLAQARWRYQVGARERVEAPAAGR